MAQRLTALLKARFLRFRRELVVVAHAVRHRDTPLHLKLAGVLLFLYLISPIDLIPILVPVLGVLDDLIIVPWGISVVVSRLPAPVRQQAEADADRWIRRYIRRPLLVLAMVLLALILIWTGLLWLFLWLIT